MKLRWRSFLTIGVAALLAAALLTAFFLSSNGATDLDPAINTLAKLQIQDRWSHPEMLKIRAMGEKALPDLRVVLRERHHPAIKLRREAQKRFPTAAAKFGTVDDRHLRERVWVVCQAIQTLGATARPAAPELIELLAENDNTLLNGTTMALHAIGIDREITDRLDVLVEKNALGQWQKVFALRAMGRVTPPSDRSLAAIAKGLSDSSDQVQRASAEAAGTLGVSNAFIIAGLKFMQTNAVDDVVAIKACAALWKLTKDRELALRGVLPRLERRLSQPLDAHPRPGDSGQGISHGDQLFLDAAEMIRIMKLEDPDRTRARLLFENWGYKAGRIFVDMLLLPATFELGMPESKCLSICKEGLERKEDYYRIQAARLLATISERFTIDDELLKSLLADTDPNVRMYAAKIHWAKHRDASVVTPILAETLDRLKHHSYWYEHNVHIALETLRDIGPPARQAIPALEKASNDPNPKIVTLAQAALVRIRK